MIGFLLTAYVAGIPLTWYATTRWQRPKQTGGWAYHRAVRETAHRAAFYAVLWPVVLVVLVGFILPAKLSERLVKAAWDRDQ